ncbi:MAG TPA: phosphate ABC transporter substrate-binding protein PstS [Kofleriaceae bacterium]|jgi:phosphate transport system substrate-binding protein|nr:phosphate ABC transporter substrate-binding protein PstS [Kofleriaceae bacterium]
MYKMIAFSALAALCVAGCNKKKEEGGGSTAAMTKEDKGPAKASESSGPVTINGSGSSFQKQFQELAVEGFSKSNKDVKVNYGAGGSGKGRQDFSDMVTDYGCTDGLFKEADAAKAKGGPFLYFPVLLGAITVSYNLDGVDKLQLSAPTIAKIFQREIKKWDDKDIAADNPGVKLPATDIVVAHRSDGSGTTEQFTLYLNTAAPDQWKLKSGSTVEWPADTQAGNGNGGVAQIVKSTPGAVGYVDLPDAKAGGLKFATVKNQAGKYIQPSSESASAAGDGIDVKDNLTYVAVNAKGDAAYPITAPTWCVAYAKQTDKAKGAAVKAYFKYMLTDAQAQIQSIDFAPLPKSLADKAVAQLDKIQVP